MNPDDTLGGHQYTMGPASRCTMDGTEMNPNTGKPWVATDYHWEKPEFHTFYGIRNPKASHNRILIYIDKAKSSALVFWVNVEDKATGYANRRGVKSIEDARNIWNTAVNNGWTRDDSVPPRKSMRVSATYDKYVDKRNKSTNYGMKA